MITPPNRRDLLRERHRAAILRAAHELIDETGSTRFSADALAERADVSRRTIFNHFASIDDIVTRVCADVFAEAVDALTLAVARVDPDASDSMFERVSGVFLSVDLTPQIAYLGRVLSMDDASGRTANLLPAVFTRVTVLLTSVATTDPEEDAFEVELLVHTLMSGIAVIAERWVTRFGGVLDDESRSAWSVLVNRLVDRLGHGFAAPTPL